MFRLHAMGVDFVLCVGGPFSHEYIGCLAAEFHFLLFSRKAPSKGKETQRRHFYSDRVLRL